MSNLYKSISLAVLGMFAFAIIETLVLPRFNCLFPNSDFEAGTLENWTARGEAFRRQPISEDAPARRKNTSTDFQGRFWVGSYDALVGGPGESTAQGDGATGSLQSTDFVINRSKITFLLGAGDGTKATRVSLLIAGREARTIYGTGHLSDSEKMHRVVWDVSEFRGMKAKILVVDEAVDGWGHINVDDFRY